MQRPLGRPAGRGFGCSAVWPWRLPASARWGARSACPPVQRVVTQMAGTKAAEQTGALEAAKQAAALEATMWVVASATGTRATARGETTRTLGVRELVTARALAVMPLLTNH